MKLVCIVCPRGCNLTVEKSGEEFEVTGNGCPRGKQYAIDEMTCPMRVLTSSVFVEDGNYKLLSVKTAGSIPKAKLEQALKEVAKVRAKAPVNIGDVLIHNIADTGVDLVATRKIARA